MDPNVAQALHFISARTLNEKVSAKGGIVDGLIDARKTDREIVDELCWTCCSRSASAAEIVAVDRAMATAMKPQASATVAKKPDPASARRQVFIDLLWAMLSSPEFTFNH